MSLSRKQVPSFEILDLSLFIFFILWLFCLFYDSNYDIGLHKQ